MTFIAFLMAFWFLWALGALMLIARWIADRYGTDDINETWQLVARDLENES